MLGVEAAEIRKAVLTAAVISMFRFAPGTDILIAANSRNRVDAEGVTRAMYNVGHKASGSSPTQLSKNFLREKSHLLAIEDGGANLHLENADKVDGGSHLRFTQTYNGIPVHRGEVIVSMNANNEVGMVINNYKANINLALATNRVGPSSAVAAVRATLPGSARLIGEQEEAKLTVWQDEHGKYHIAYRVRLTTEYPSGDWEAFVEASNTKVLRIENRFANSMNGVYVQGSGYVYLTDPLSAAHKRYGALGFADNNDADSDSLNAYRVRVTLDSLIFEDGVYKLKGPYCEVTDIESPANSMSYAMTNKDGFDFTRSQQAFEAVNVYYHISKSYQYIESLGFSSVSLRQIRLDPHGFQGVDNSHYSPNGNWIAWGDGGVDDAEDVDAILHEYGHAIVFNFCPTWGGGESGALGEGYSDYWAASNSRSMKSWRQADYEYNWVYNWNAHNVFMLGRCVNDRRTYPFGDLEIHDAGQIWSSALMSIWRELGKEVADKLVLKSLHYLGAAATGIDAAQALLQADRDLFSGAHLSTLLYLLGTEKHFLEPDNYVPTIMHTPLTDTSFLNGPPKITAMVSQIHPVDAVWVEFRINSVSTVRTFFLSHNVGGLYGGEFSVTAPVLNVGDTISYRVLACYSNNQEIHGTTNEFKFRITDLTTSAASQGQPTGFSLNQNYPNPFNPSTNISFSLSEQTQVMLRIYNLLGQEVATIASGVYNAGTINATWNGTDANGTKVASGTYVYQLTARSITSNNELVQQKKLILAK